MTQITKCAREIRTRNLFNGRVNNRIVAVCTLFFFDQCHSHSLIWHAASHIPPEALIYYVLYIRCDIYIYIYMCVCVCAYPHLNHINVFVFFRAPIRSSITLGSTAPLHILPRRWYHLSYIYDIYICVLTPIWITLMVSSFSGLPHLSRWVAPRLCTYYRGADSICPIYTL